MEPKSAFVVVLALCLFFLVPLLEALTEADQPKLVKASYTVYFFYYYWPHHHFIMCKL